ncbi:MAG: ParB N-terminal domain-containing protein [Candidatus Saccharimonas sp.]|jgi:ParB-like chromosome segregation protein Spo0J|nr:ParB N-terminal domain-containing protein [Candidatus Saccharimonas sp.]
MYHDPHARPDGELRMVDISLIRVNPKKLRKLSTAKIQRYSTNYERDDQFPPIVVEDCGDFYTIRDGRHRFQAQLLTGAHCIEVSLYN